VLDLSAIAFGAEIYLVCYHTGIDDKRWITSTTKTGEAFLEFHQTCGGLLTFYTDGLGFLSHYNSPDSELWRYFKTIANNR
jgi:hypothetical protein